MGKDTKQKHFRVPADLADTLGRASVVLNVSENEIHNAALFAFFQNDWRLKKIHESIIEDKIKEVKK